MRRPKFEPALKPAAQHEAETRGIGDELSEIRNEIELAALAVVGLGEYLDDDNGSGLIIANRLRLVSDKLDDINDRLSPVDIEATKLKLASIEGKRAA